VFDQSERFLRDIGLSDDELTKGIIGGIGDMDAYQLPDAKGFTSMVRELSGVTDEDLQRIREEILGTKAEDFRAFADVLDYVRNEGLVKVLGSETAIQKTMDEQPGWLSMLKVM